MQKKFLPIAIGALLCALFASNSAQAKFVNSCDAQANRTAPVSDTSQIDAGGHYLGEVTQMGNLRWNFDKMPLKVFIDDGSGTPGYQDYYQDYMRKAFNEWQNTSNGKITWREVSSPNQADIVCIWTAEAKANGPGVEAGETKSTIGVNRFTGEQNIIRARISVLTSLMGRPFSDLDTYKTCLHEVGHAIGMEGHSNTPSDIMYPVLNKAQTPYLKPRDINTIAHLYSAPSANAYVAEAPRFSPQFGQAETARGYAPQREFPRARSFRPAPGANRITPINIENLSYEQREALRRALRDRMRSGASTYGTYGNSFGNSYGTTYGSF